MMKHGPFVGQIFTEDFVIGEPARFLEELLTAVVRLTKALGHDDYKGEFVPLLNEAAAKLEQMK